MDSPITKAEHEEFRRRLEEENGRLEVLESRDGEMWRKLIAYIMTAIAGIVMGFIFTKLGF